MRRSLVLLLLVASLAGCAEGARIRFEPPAADASERSGAHTGPMIGRSGFPQSD